MIQERFDETIGLIGRHADVFPILHQLLSLYERSILVFSYFDKPAIGNGRLQILEEYQLRMTLSRRNGNSLPFSSQLLDSLQQTRHEYICISTFVTGVGTFNIFSDFAREDLVAVLFSKSQPEQVPVYSHLFMNGELLSRER